MPVNNPGGAGGGAGGSGQQQQGGAQRATFRPPWVKQGPQPIPMPSAPWSPVRRASNTAQDAAGPAKEPAPVRKQSKITIIPSHPTNQSAPPPKENGQNGPGAVPAEQPGDAQLAAFARLSALVRKLEDMERRHDEEALRRPSLANLVAIEDQPPPWDDDDELDRDAEPDWWRDMQQTARVDVAQARGEDAEDEDGDVQDDIAEDAPRPDVDGELAEQAPQSRRDDQDDGGPDCQNDDAEAGGPRRPMARVDTVEKKAPAQVAAVPAVPEKRPAAAAPDNGRVTEEPRRRPTLVHQKSSTTQRPVEAAAAAAAPSRAAPQAPPPPPAPPAPPAPPPAPPAPPPPAFLADKKALTAQQAQKLEQLRNRARKRPDYSCLMKEIEGGTRLKRVHCNDRSQPLLPMAKAKDQFIYDSETSNKHNQLLKQIESGIKLKSVKCNDRSRPVLDGLRKFRRQMTVEEQLQKADAPEVLAEPDDLDDIDRVRDDLQSTKQMLALELRNKEAMERENKRLLARLLNLEAELEAERNRQSAPQNGGAPSGPAPDTDKLVAKLKAENEAQQKETKEMETRYHQAAEELDSTKAQLAEALFQKKQAEKQLKEIEDGLVEGGRALQKTLSKKLIASKSGDIRKQMSQAKINELRKQSIPVQEDSESEYTDETITDSEGEEEEDLSNDPEAQEKRVQRELKLLATKLKAFKDKEASARRERTALREQLKLQQKALREERKKYKSLQKEVDKMAKLMREDEEEGDEDEDEEEEEEEEEESEESESEESEDDEGSGEDLPADAPVDDKRNNLNTRTRRHEGILGALKKGNYLLKANIDRVKDDLSKHREMSLMLQEDLNSVLAELG